MSSITDIAKSANWALYIWVGWLSVVMFFCASFYLTVIDAGSPIRPDHEILGRKLQDEVYASTDLLSLKEKCGGIAEMWDAFREVNKSQWESSRALIKMEFGVLIGLGTLSGIACFCFWWRLRQLAMPSGRNGL